MKKLNWLLIITLILIVVAINYTINTDKTNIPLGIRIIFGFSSGWFLGSLYKYLDWRD